MFDFGRITLFSLENRLSKPKMTIFSKYLGGAMATLVPPPGYAYGASTLRRRSTRLLAMEGILWKLLHENILRIFDICAISCTSNQAILLQ